MGIIEHPPIFRVPAVGPLAWLWSGYVPDHVTYTWLAIIIMVALAFTATRRVALVPEGVQNLLEVIVEQFQQLIDDVIGHEGRRYLPLIATLGLFILFMNLMGLVPGVAGPTTNVNTTASCAIIVFFAYH